MMLDLYWRAFLAGAKALRVEETNAMLNGAKPEQVAPQISIREGELVVDGETIPYAGEGMMRSEIINLSPVATFEQRLEFIGRVLKARERMIEKGIYGPFIVKVPSSIDLSTRYFSSNSEWMSPHLKNITIKDRILSIDGVSQVESYDGILLEVQQLQAGTGG